jgi:hypothetical protein
MQSGEFASSVENGAGSKHGYSLVFAQFRQGPIRHAFGLPNRYQHRTWDNSFCTDNVPEWLYPFTAALEARLSHHQLLSGTPLGKRELS